MNKEALKNENSVKKYKDIIREALQGYDFPEMRQSPGGLNRKT